MVKTILYTKIDDHKDLHTSMFNFVRFARFVNLKESLCLIYCRLTGMTLRRWIAEESLNWRLTKSPTRLSRSEIRNKVVTTLSTPSE